MRASRRRLRARLGRLLHPRGFALPRGFGLPLPRGAALANSRRRLAAQAGMTLIELIVVVALVAVVAGALMGPLEVSQRVQTRDMNYAYAQQDERTGLDGMVSQIRQAYAILSSGANFVEMNVSLNGTALHVYYECDIPQVGTSYNECLRVQAAAGSSLPSLSTGTIVIKNLLNGTAADPVFSFGPDPVAPYYMTATVKVPASGGTKGGLTHTIALSDGALMRNMNVGN